MIPVLYEGNEREFISQGIGSLKDVISCKVTEELNGSYELTMEYPAFGALFSEIQLGRLILAEPAPHKETEPFSIYKISEPIDGIVTINAEHISYRLSYIPVKPFSAASCTAALNGLISHAVEECPFKVWTDKKVEATFNLTIPQSFRLCLGGIDGSILDTYKGEYEFNRFNIKLHTHRGSLKDSAKIIYGRNLIDLTQEETIEKTVTGIIPYWKGSVTVSNSNDTTTSTEKVITLPEYVIKSEYSGKYPYERTIVYDFSSDFQDEPTVDELRERCKQYMKDNVTGVPDVSLTISFANLSDYEENKGVSDQIIYLGDSVPVLFAKYDITATAKVVSVDYDVIEERYNSITLGNARASLSKSMSQLDQKQEENITRSELELSLILAQKVIAGGAGGYIVTRYVNGHPSETIYGDTDDINTMVNCIRINKNGIGFSNNGFNGPYKSAWTIDGRFNADYIQTGTLRAIAIEGVTITGSTISGATVTGGVIKTPRKIEFETTYNDVTYHSEIMHSVWNWSTGDVPNYSAGINFSSNAIRFDGVDESKYPNNKGLETFDIKGTTFYVTFNKLISFIKSNQIHLQAIDSNLYMSAKSYISLSLDVESGKPWPYISIWPNSVGLYMSTNDTSSDGLRALVKIDTSGDVNIQSVNSDVYITGKHVYLNGFTAVRSYDNTEIYLLWNNTTLSAYVNGKNVWNSSDRRLKGDIENLSDDYIEAIGSVDIKQYIFTDEIYNHEIKHFGVIAQDVREALEDKGIEPESIAMNGHYDKDGTDYYTIDKNEFFMARIAYDEKRINALEQQNKSLEARLKALEEKLCQL